MSILDYSVKLALAQRSSSKLYMCTVLTATCLTLLVPVDPVTLDP